MLAAVSKSVYFGVVLEFFYTSWFIPQSSSSWLTRQIGPLPTRVWCHLRQPDASCLQRFALLLTHTVRCMLLTVAEKGSSRELVVPQVATYRITSHPGECPVQIGPPVEGRREA